MARRLGNNLYRLPVQLIISFIALVILTAVAIGLPAIYIIRAQQDRQAWALVDQGSHTTNALYSARQSDLNSLAILTAQRPTLQDLLMQSDKANLQTYLETLRSGASLDMITLCAPDGRLIAQVGQPTSVQICAETTLNGEFYVEPSTRPDHAWLLNSQPVPEGTNFSSKVVIGLTLDHDLLAQLQEQTGMEQALLFNNQIVATSFPDPGKLSDALNRSSGASTQLSFALGGLPYYSTRSNLKEGGLENLVALDVSDIAATQKSLTLSLLASILGVAVLGSGLGMLLAQRIGQPLADLKNVAVTLRKGNLVSPVSIKTNVPEVAVVAYALEDARVALHHTLSELRQEKDWIEHLLESIVESIVTLDRHGRITYFSRGAERMLGWSQEKVLGHFCDEVFRPVEENKSFSELIPAPGRQQKILLALRDGRQVTLAVTGARLAPPEAGKARVALVLRDVSDEEAVHRLLGDFLANISHEFRTPLSALAASIELLLDQLPDLSQEDLRDLINSLHLGVLSLQTLIDNLLEGASIESGRFRVFPHNTDLSEIVAEVSQGMKPLLDKYGQRLVISLPDNLPTVQADFRRTSQVLVNLISNAIKWGPEGAQITITAEPGKDVLEVAVADQGPGVPLEHQDDLFRRFVHVDLGSDRAEYGAGLGLSVVKAIVEAQGGQVGVKNRPGGGAIFWFTLPLAKAQREPEATIR